MPWTRITQEYVDAQFPKDVPSDWETNMNYCPHSRRIMSEYVKFTKVFVGMYTKEGTKLHLVPPSLYWGFDHEEWKKVSLLLNYMPSNLTHKVKVGEHPATARRDDGRLHSSSWTLVQYSAGEQAYDRIAKTNFTPFAYSYNGEPEEIFTEKNLEIIMAAYKVFLETFFRESDRVFLASVAVLAQVVTLFGGKSAWRKFVNDNNLSFFSDSTEANTIVTVCHPEYLYNPRYLNWTHWYYALLHDRLYTELGRFMGMGGDYVCTVGRDIANKNGGTAAYMLLLQIGA
jgi:hypothetical protein